MGTPALFSLVFLCVLCAFVVSPASAQTTISGTVKDASGTALTSGTIIFTLSQEGTVTDPALLVVQPVVTCTITNGVIGTCSLRGNDEISPAGTVYRVRIISSGGRTFLPERTYSITGATWDIGTQTPNPSSVQTGIHGASLHSGDVIPPANQEFGAFYSDFSQIAAPANPAAGTRRLFMDSATGEISVRTSAGTTVSLEAGGGGGATHQIDGVGLTTQDPINFLDTSEFDWTNPAAGNLSLALKAASVADSKLTSNYSGVGSCAASNFVTGVNDNAAPTCASIADADLPSTNALDTELHAQTHVLAGSDHTASGLTIGNVVRATGATTFAWQQLGFSDLSGSATDAQVPDSITLTNITQITTRAITDLTGTAGRSQLPAQVVYDDEANTYGAFAQNFSAATLEVPNAITVPGTCQVGEVFHDTDAAAGLRYFLCTALNTFTAIDNPFGTAVDIGEVSFDPILETELDTIAEFNTQITDATIEVQANKNAASGYAGLTAGTKLQLSQGQEVWAIADLSDVTAKSGNTTVVGTTSGALGAGNCAEFDASGNIVDSGAGCGGGAGDNISVNGTAAVDADFDDATPAAPANSVNVRFQKDSGTPNNISANLLLTDIDGNGIGVSSTELIVDLLTADDQVGSSSNQSGLEFGGAGSDKLGLLRACTNGQVLKFNTTGGLWECQNDNDSGGSPTLDAITSAAGANTINNGDNAQVWNFSLTTADKIAFKFGENTASVATGNPVILNVATLAASTAHPFQATSRGTANGVRVGATDGILVALGTGGLDWPALLNYPAGCTNQFVRAILDTPTCNTVGTSDIAGNAADNTIIRDSAGFSVIGKTATGTGDPADIVAADETVLGRTGAGNLVFAQVATGQVAGNAITFAKMQDIATDRIMGRDTAATGDPEELTVGGGVEFTGSGGIQRSALTGDVTASAGSNTTAIAAGVVASAELATANKTFKCNFVLFRDTGLKDSDDINTISNCSRPGRAITITEVIAETDAGSPVINLQRDDGTPANILSSDCTATTGGATCTIAAAEDNIAATDKIDFVAVSGMSGANRVSILIEFTVDP